MGTTKSGDIPGGHTVCVGTTAHAAATATETRAVWEAPFDVTLTSVEIAADIAVTGAATHYTSIELIDGGAGGIGTTEIGNKDLASGTNLAAAVPAELLGTDGAGTDATLDEGDVLILQFTKVGNGVLVPPMALIIHYRAT